MAHHILLRNISDLCMRFEGGTGLPSGNKEGYLRPDMGIN